MSEPREPIRRRTFLALLGATVAAGGVGAWELAKGSGRDRDSHAVALHVAAAFSDPAAARAVGEAYLQAHPRERDEGRLVRGLRESSRAWGRVARPDDVRRLARTESRRDYAAGRVTAVGGWYLSLTEARMCALTTLAART